MVKPKIAVSRETVYRAPNRAWLWRAPNWQDASAYPDDLQPDQWRWQFLRRNKSYQQDWAIYSQIKYFQWPSQLPPWPPEDSSLDERAKRIAEMPGCREKYNVEYLLDPNESQPWLNLFVVRAPFCVSPYDGDKLGKWEAAGLRLIAFDLEQPLAAQIAEAHELLKKLQEFFHDDSPRSRDRTQKWPLYLRIFDARTAGLTFQKIGQSLLNKTDYNDAAATSKQMYTAAIKLINKDLA